MSSRGWWVTISICLIAIFVLVIVFPTSMLNPGPVLEAHQALQADCFACHTPLLGNHAKKCVTCHQVDRISLFTTQGEPVVATKGSFHQHLTEQTCTVCHLEHQGVTGINAMKPFSHTLLQQNVRTDCASCHSKPPDSLHQNVASGCDQCHTSTAWTPASFDHATHFQLDRDHNVQCATCHVGNTFNQYTCYGCHEHTITGIRAEHVEEGIREFDNCVECHRSSDEPDERDGRDGRKEHNDDQE